MLQTLHHIYSPSKNMYVTPIKRRATVDPRTPKKRKSSTVNKAALNLMVRRAIGSAAESKEVLNAFANTFNATQTYVKCLNLVAEGNDYNTRIGRSINHKYIECDVALYCQTSGSGNVGDFGFWAIVIDRQPQGSLASFSDIFDGSNGIAHRVTNQNQDRFKILAREEYAVGGNASSATATAGAVPYHLRRYIDLSRLKGTDAKTKFQGTGGTISDIDGVAILFVAASYLTTAAVNTLLFANVKYRFTDL